MFLKCEEVEAKIDFISVSECFFNGHCIKFVDWIHNFHIDKVKCKVPTWFSMVSLPSELCDVDIIYSIGSVIGEVIALDASFFSCNSIKLLINVNIDHPFEFQQKVETCYATYDINVQRYKGKIIDILRSDETHKIRPLIIPLTSDLRNEFP